MAEFKKQITNIHATESENRNEQVVSKQQRKKRLKQRLVVAGMAFIVLFGLMITFHIKQRSVEADLKTEYDELDETFTELKSQEKNLREEIDLLNDEEYILDIARTNYFLSKEGEVIFHTRNPDEQAY